VLLGWAYLLFGLLSLPRHRAAAAKTNPFA
jgi:hypothetical protein